MKARKLGKSDIHISEIGFGTWGIGGNAYGQTDDGESTKALHKAAELGITLFDTAPIYGMGRSEELLGKAFANNRNKMIFATKLGMVDETGRQDFTVPFAEQSISTSLTRLKTDYIDLLQLHGPSPEQVTSELYEFLEAQKKSGKIRAIGVSVRNPKEGLDYCRVNFFDSIQVNLNLFDQRAIEYGLLNLAQEQSVGLVARTPLGFGFLTGKTAGEDLEKTGDHRARFSENQRNLWANSTEKFFSNEDSNNRQTAAQFALRFCLSFSSITSVIPGMLTVSQVVENVLASELGPLAETELNNIFNTYRENEFVIRS